MRLLVTLLAIVALLAAPVFAQPADIAALAGVTVFFYSASPLGSGQLVSATTLGAKVNADLEAEFKSATFVELRLRNRGWIFHVAKLPAQGQAVAETQVKVNGGIMTLSTAALDLEAALAGRRNVAIFTTGVRGAIVAVVPISAAGTLTTNRVTIQATGATHVEVLLNGHSRLFRVVSLGASLDAVMVAAVSAEASAGENATGAVDSLLDIIRGLP